MKKYMALALALLLVSSLFTGCGRGTVSEDPDGMITDPTGTVVPTSPIPPMTAPTVEPTHPRATVPEAVRPDSPSTAFSGTVRS